MTTTQAAGAGGADQEIATRITHALIVKNISVKALSEETGISYPILRSHLKGGRSFTFQQYLRIASVLQVHPATLLPTALTDVAA